MYAAGTYSLSLILEFGAGPRICIYNSAQVTLMLLVQGLPHLRTTDREPLTEITPRVPSGSITL